MEVSGDRQLNRTIRVQTHQSDHLDTSLVELRLQPGECAQLRSANRGEIGRVGEEDGPVVADKLVEVDLSMGSQGLEVGSCIANVSNERYSRLESK